jgi:hypothetical protein
MLKIDFFHELSKSSLNKELDFKVIHA